MSRTNYWKVTPQMCSPLLLSLQSNIALQGIGTVK